MKLRFAPFALALLASVVSGSCCMICIPLHPGEAPAPDLAVVLGNAP